MSLAHSSDMEGDGERKQGGVGDAAPINLLRLAHALRRLDPADFDAVMRSGRSIQPLAVSDNDSLCAQLVTIPRLASLRECRTTAARVMKTPHGWLEADTQTAVAAMEHLHRGSFEGCRDCIVSLVGGPGTGKSYSLDQITSLAHASPGMVWAATTATVAVTFNDSMNLVRKPTRMNLWEEVVLRLLFSHYFTHSRLPFIAFQEALGVWINTSSCDSTTVTDVLLCIQQDVLEAGKTTLLLAVDELIRVDTLEQGFSVAMLSAFAAVMDSMNAVKPRSMMLVVTSLSAAPLEAIRPAASDSGRPIHGVALPLLCGSSAVDLVAHAAAHPGEPSDSLRPLVVKLVAMCGGHPRTLECACLALRGVLVRADSPRHISLASVLVLAARKLAGMYSHIVNLTVPTVLAVWSGDRLRSDHVLASPGSDATRGETVADLVERGVLFATTITNGGVWYEPRLSVVQLLAWAAPREQRERGTAAASDRQVRETVARIILDSVVPALFDKPLERVIRGALQVRMVLLSRAAPAPVTWRTLLNVAPRQQGDKKKGPYDVALARRLLLPGRSDLNDDRVTYETKERDEAGMWAVGKQLRKRLSSRTRHNKWLHPPPSKTQAYDLVMRCTEVEGTGKDRVEEPCIAFAQVKGLDGGTEDPWGKGHTSKVQQSCQHCRKKHKGNMLFIAAAYMDTENARTTLTKAGAAAFIVLDREGCRRLMGMPLYTAFDTVDRLAQATPSAEGSAAVAVAGAGAGAGAGGGSA